MNPSSPPPWSGTPIALPLNLRIRATELAAEIAGWLPDHRFHLTGDGAYACLAGAALPPTHLMAPPRRRALPAGVAAHRPLQHSIATIAAARYVSRTSVYRHLPRAGSAHHSPGGR